MKRKKYAVVGYDGLPCPRCGELSEVRKHLEMTDKIRSQPFYFTIWFNCVNKSCKTGIFMSEDYKIWNKNAAARDFLIVQQEREEREQQLSFLRSI